MRKIWLAYVLLCWRCDGSIPYLNWYFKTTEDENEFLRKVRKFFMDGWYGWEKEEWAVNFRYWVLGYSRYSWHPVYGGDWIPNEEIKHVQECKKEAEEAKKLVDKLDKKLKAEHHRLCMQPKWNQAAWNRVERDLGGQLEEALKWLVACNNFQRRRFKPRFMR